MPTAEILSQGDEVVTGQTVDRNAAWLSVQLTELGFQVIRHTTVGDTHADIVEAVSAASERVDLALSTGGLGPTEDDLTAEAVGDAFGMPIALDEQALVDIKAMYARYGRVMPEVNRKQAMMPVGCERIDNAWGTAPGFAVATKSCWLAFMPGVPREMKAMFAERVVPLLHERFALDPYRLITVRTAGVGESNIQERLDGLVLPEGVVLSFRTKLPENHVKLRIPPHFSDDAIKAMVDDMSGRIGSPVFAIEGLGGPEGSLTEIVGQALGGRAETVASAESCTGGRVAAMFTGVAGSSAWFLEGAVTYSNASKMRQLGVPEALLIEHGAVSEQVARQMAIGIRERSGSTYGLATTGIAGPGGGTESKPVGTVHIAVAYPGGVHHRALRFGGNRQRVQDLSAASVIDLLRRHLQGVL